MSDSPTHPGPATSRHAGAGRTVAVLGATGQQGGSVSDALLAAGWTVRAVVRNPGGPRARSLAAAGAEIVRGDLADPESLRAAFAGAHGVFSVQPSSGQAGAGVSDDDEIRYGVAVADAAEHSGARHLVYSSMIAAGPEPTGVRHFDVKSRIEDHVRSLGITTTVVRPATFMELLPAATDPGRGELTFLMRPDQAMQLVAVQDIGRVAAEILGAPDRFGGRTVEIAGDALTGTEIADQVAHAARRPITYRRVPQGLLDQDEVLTRSAALVDDGRLAGRADLEALRATFPFLLRFDQWLAGPGQAHLHQLPCTRLHRSSSRRRQHPDR